MNFEGPVVAWLILALVPIGLPVALAVLLKAVLKVEVGCLSLVGLLVLGVVLGIGITVYIDSAGNTVKGEVIMKREFLIYHLDGSWNRKTTAEISFRPADGEPNIVKTFELLPARFDDLSQGDFVDLRCPSKRGMLPVYRLEDQHSFRQIWFWLTNEPFLLCFVLGLVGVLVVSMMWNANMPTLFLLSGVVTVGAWWFSNVGLIFWEQSTALFGSTNSINATVREVHPPYLGTGLHGWLSTHLYKASDLILLDIVPAGRSEPTLSIDEVDLGSVSLRDGQALNVDYSTANPRQSMVPDATRSYIWKNGLLNTLLALLALAGIAKIAHLIGGKTEEEPPVTARRKRKKSEPAA